MPDTLVIGGQTFSNVTGIKATDDQSATKTYILPTGTLTVTDNGTSDCTAYASVSVSIPSATGVSF